MKQSEYITEGWVKFLRNYCKEGFIDVWIGDSIDNPNNENESQEKLNSNSRAYRLNGIGKWKTDFSYSEKHSLDGFINIMRDNCSAEEIWNVVFNS